MTTTRRVKPTGKMAYLADIKKDGGLLLPKLKKIVLDESGWDPERDIRHIHPSEMCKSDWCDRTTFLRLKYGADAIPEEKFNFVLENIWEFGNDVHAKWQRRFRKTGQLWGSWQCQICHKWSHDSLEPRDIDGICVNAGVQHLWEYKEAHLLDEETMIYGHADGAFLDWGWLAEIKTIGKGTVRIEAPKLFNKYYVKTTGGKTIHDVEGLWAELKRPFTSHVKQANIYLWLTWKLGVPYERMVFIYESKMNQQTKEFSITMSDRIVNPLVDRAKAIAYAVREGEDIACPYDGGCPQCHGAEERLRATGAEGFSGPARRPAVRASEQGSGVPAEGPGDRPGKVRRTTRRGAARAAQEHHGDPGRGTDAVVQGVLPVGPVPEAPARRSGGRRTLTRKGSSPDRGP